MLAEDRSTSRLYRINDTCVTRFPTAADLVMGETLTRPARRMTMVSADRDEIRAAVAARYAGLARAAQAGQAITDGDPDAPGCAAAYPDAGLPEAAVRASLASATRSR